MDAAVILIPIVHSERVNFNLEKQWYEQWSPPPPVLNLNLRAAGIQHGKDKKVGGFYLCG